MIRIVVEGADVAAVRLALLDVLEAVMPKTTAPVPVATAVLAPAPAVTLSATPAPTPPAAAAAPRRGRKPAKPKDDPLPPAVETTPASEAEARVDGDDVPPVSAEEDLRDDGTAALLASLDPPKVVTVTRDQLRDAAQSFIQARGVNAAMALLAEYNVQKFAELPEAKWGEMFTKLGGKL